MFYASILFLFLFKQTIVSLSIPSTNLKKLRVEPSTCGKRPPNIVRYIHGGKQSYAETWPWQVHLRLCDEDDTKGSDCKGYHYCGAILLNDKWILTAAHCFSSLKQPRIHLLLNKNSTHVSDYKWIQIEKIVTHPKYHEITGKHEYSTNDLALVKLSKKDQLTHRVVAPCLPIQNSIIPTDTVCHITGFGNSDKSDRERSKRLKEARVVIKHDSVCVRTLNLEHYDENTMLCAGSMRNSRANSCQGDSGGPLVCEGYFNRTSINQQTSWFLFGITSFGALDCATYSNSVYTRVSKYVDWIQNTLLND